MMNKQSMYSLGTTLLLDLTNASAAADLFGKDALQSESPNIKDKWVDGFIISWFSVTENTEVKNWRIILDTEEKLSWFSAQVGDDVDVVDLGIVKVEDFYFSKIQQHQRMSTTRGDVPMTKLNKIILRNGKPFPTPYEVKP